MSLLFFLWPFGVWCLIFAYLFVCFGVVWWFDTLFIPFGTYVMLSDFENVRIYVLW